MQIDSIGIGNHCTFQGELFYHGSNKKLKKIVPFFTEILKDKPYDVYMKEKLYKTSPKGRIHRITFFNALNYGYMKHANDNFCESHSYTRQTKYGSYKHALQTVIEDMDNKISFANAQKKRSVLKECFSKMYKEIIKLWN